MALPIAGKARESSPRGSARSGRPSAKRQRKRKIAAEQINSLLDLALREHPKDAELSQRHAQIAWKLSTRFNIRLRERRLLFCRACKEFIVPPTEARYRLNAQRDGMTITCLKCGFRYRKLFSKAK